MADQSESHLVTQAKRSSPLHHHRETHGRSNDIDDNTPLTHVKGPNVFERMKEEVEAIVQTVHSKDREKKERAKDDRSSSHNHPRQHHHHHKETHGRSDDIDETTSMDEVKGPNVFQRMKEEMEAIIEVIHTKKGSDGHGHN